MSIYFLKRINDKGHDMYDAKVVRAATPKEAREIANKITGDEGRIWTDTKKVWCSRVKENAKSCEILGSFNAG